MNASFLISRKRDGGELTAGEIRDLVDGFVQGTVADYQMSAWAMAVYLNGMTVAETAALTQAMLDSGQTLPRPTGAVWVDKHSTGGVGDKVSLILAPLLACCDLQVPMISGRGLGATGGTLDKLESIPGFRTDLSITELTRLTGSLGCVITGASPEIAPADKKLYALRDVTATVASIPLITASVMSKKLAENLNALVLDVKWGSGAFMKTIEDARKLAQSLVETGRQMDVKTSALITDMHQPLGRMVGNAVEVEESIEVLRGGGPPDLLQVTLELGAELCVLADPGLDRPAAIRTLQSHLDSGRAYDRFERMVAGQGGDLTAPRAVETCRMWASIRAGYVQSIDAERLGQVVIELGGGRRTVHERINHSVGLEMLVRIGDPVDMGQPLMHVFGPDGSVPRLLPLLSKAFVIGDQPVKPPQLIAERM